MSTVGLWVIGAGGHAKVVLEACRAAALPVAGVFDDDPAAAGRDLLGFSVAGAVPPPVRWRAERKRGILAVGSNRAREALATRLAGVDWATVVHPSAVVAPDVVLGPGVFVAPRVVINPGAVIGAHVILNTGAIVEHDCRIGDFTHVAPGSVLTGNVTLGRRVLFGAGAVAIPGVSVADDTVCGAGAVLTADVSSAGIVVGVPARAPR
ncbi:acetyltransferase [Chelatococcus sp. SYSU_G07232]|uniref:Acetyltransferase n=1 Tax=Chelatococcus albus TaxID=3047466 RepID=A0ABT7AFN6_9HYPH|nr:acetyltransferase [Chelatococcus sp. SYSU_G07232]MDJ1158188.1 acetyltransferase [Chelatococcus sp. SYSU_G07232]